MKKPIVWTIGGVDPSGLAWIHVDLETFRNFNVDVCSVITAVTAQNNDSVSAIEWITSDLVSAQCDVLQHSFIPSAIKIGMIGDKKCKSN